MSRHHRAQKWTTKSPKLRRQINAMLPQPCVECRRLIGHGERWHVGHRLDAMDGGAATLENVGPVHPACNLKAGGARGAQVANARRRAATRSPDIRPW